MPITHYIAETDADQRIAAVWVKPKDRKSARVFNPLDDLFDPNDPAKFDGATEADITEWIAAQKVMYTP